MLNRYFQVLLLLGVLSFPLFSASGAGDPQVGKPAYTKSCAICHGADGEPKPAMMKMLKVEMRHLGSEEVQALSDEEHRRIMVDGRGKMKPVKGVSAADLDNVIAFIRTLAMN